MVSVAVTLIISALLLSLVSTRLMLAYALRSGLLDIPNRRSSHTTPTPRGGGVGIVVGVVVSWSVVAFQEVEQWRILMPLACLMGMALIGWWDDRRGLSARFRLLAQLSLAGIALGVLRAWELPVRLSGWTLELPILVFIFWWLFSTWLTNLYNFMDGIDGITGQQGAFVGFGGGVLLISQGEPTLALLYFSLGAACLGFLWWNWSPARIFMGDVASAFIGLAFALLAVQAQISGLALVVLLVLHAAFIADSTYTLIRRLFLGRKPHEAHRTHLYQKLVRKGHSHGRIAGGYLGYNVFLLFPLAYLVMLGFVAEWLGLAIAYVPIFLACFGNQVGEEPVLSAVPRG